MIKTITTALAAFGIVICAAGSVHAQANFVTNGSFEIVTGTTTGGQLNDEVTATGWNTTGYNFLFDSTDASNGGVTGSDGNLQLWGPGNGSANGLTTSPDGGNFVAADGAYEVAPITQTINGLTVGQTYAVTFYWGAAQQSGFNGATTDKWTVSLGSQSQSTPVISLPNHGFSGWTQQSFGYTATSTSEVLSFLATGTPNGEPPFALLDGVSLVATPEPSTLATMFIGLLGLGAIVVLRVRSKKSAL